MEVADWAVCLALTPQREVVLVRQFRFGSGELSWELPAGLVDPGEDPVTAALRELREESGYSVPEGVCIGQVQPNPAVQRNRCHFILGLGAEPGEATSTDPHEAFEVTKLPLQDCAQWALDGRIQHGLVHAALWFHERWEERA